MPAPYNVWWVTRQQRFLHSLKGTGLRGAWEGPLRVRGLHLAVSREELHELIAPYQLPLIERHGGAAVFASSCLVSTEPFSGPVKRCRAKLKRVAFLRA